MQLISSKYQNYSKASKEKSLKNTLKSLELQQVEMLKKSNLSMAEFNKFSIENGLGNIDGFINLENAVVNESDSNTSQKRSQNQKIPKCLSR